MTWLNNLSITMKISVSFIALQLALLGFGIWAYQFSNQVHDGGSLILEESQPFAELANQM